MSDNDRLHDVAAIVTAGAALGVTLAHFCAWLLHVRALARRRLRDRARARRRT